MEESSDEDDSSSEEQPTPRAKAIQNTAEDSSEDASSSEEEAPAKTKVKQNLPSSVNALLLQGLKKGAKGKPVEEESDEEEESESEEESEEEEDFIPLGNKRPQQSNGESFSKKQKFDNTTSDQYTMSLCYLA